MDNKIPVARVYSTWDAGDKAAFAALKAEATEKLGVEKIPLKDFIMAVEPGHDTPEYLLEV
jgi:hypothetical protein